MTAALEPAARKAVMGAGAPWYTSGVHTCKGAMDSLKARPVSSRPRPRSTRGPWLAPTWAARLGAIKRLPPAA